MSLLKILKYPDKRLRNRANEVRGESVHKLTEDMLETMYSAPGIGLAATQVGIPLRVTVIDITPPEKGKNPIVLINPVLIKGEGKVIMEEGCLSFPGVYELVKRYERVIVEALNLEGKKFKIEANGLLARTLQHEIDHLNGLIFIDRLSPSVRKSAIKKYKKLHGID